MWPVSHYVSISRNGSFKQSQTNLIHVLMLYGWCYQKLAKILQIYHQFGKNWNNFGDFSDNSAVLHVTTKLVTEQCKLNMQYCMIHHINQNCSADAKMYHTWLYVKCTMIYDHICAPFWRSVSASGHGNVILNMLPRSTQVRSRQNLNRGGNALNLCER